ncbi:MAG: hypothetical protein AAGJ40_09310 [Planctomycetota bacterium]
MPTLTPTTTDSLEYRGYQPAPDGVLSPPQVAYFGLSEPSHRVTALTFDVSSVDAATLTVEMQAALPSLSGDGALRITAKDDVISTNRDSYAEIDAADLLSGSSTITVIPTLASGTYTWDLASVFANVPNSASEVTLFLATPNADRSGDSSMTLSSPVIEYTVTPPFAIALAIAPGSIAPGETSTVTVTRSGAATGTVGTTVTSNGSLTSAPGSFLVKPITFSGIGTVTEGASLRVKGTGQFRDDMRILIQGPGSGIETLVVEGSMGTGDAEYTVAYSNFNGNDPNGTWQIGAQNTGVTMMTWDICELNVFTQGGAGTEAIAVDLASGTPAIATVDPATLLIPSGSSSATATASGVSAGSATITGTYSGVTPSLSDSVSLTVTAPPGVATPESIEVTTELSDVAVALLFVALPESIESAFEASDAVAALTPFADAESIQLQVELLDVDAFIPSVASPESIESAAQVSDASATFQPVSTSKRRTLLLEGGIFLA